MQEYLTPAAALPADGTAGTLVGRAWLPGEVPGPGMVAIRDDGVFDLSRVAPTITDLLNADDPVALARAAGKRIGDLAPILANSAHDQRDAASPYFLAPCDLQALKASGVTFATSLLERVIEEHARGDASKAAAIRRTITGVIGTDLSKIQPGSAAAMRLKAHLIEQGAWSQYLEVGIGPDAEIFTKAPPMSAVGTGSEIGIRAELLVEQPGARAGGRGERARRASSARRWATTSICATSRGAARCCSARARTTTRPARSARSSGCSTTRSPWISCAALRSTCGSAATDGFELTGTSSMAEISRDVADLVGQTISPNHQYPDGLMLFCGTMFAPIQDREHPGQGFTHKLGDVVTIACPELGTLVNRTQHCDRIAPWTFGATALMRNLSARRLL